MAIDKLSIWEGFQTLIEEPENDGVEGVAKDILTSFGITCEGSEEGGKLLNVDIKRADAFSTLKASLLEVYAESPNSDLLEVMINEQGDAEFYRVGNDTAQISPYFSVRSDNYVNPSVGVQVTGAKPRQERIVYGEWFPLVGPEADSTVHDTSNLNTSCYIENLSTHATITYKDPFRHSKQSTWNNGIEGEAFELGPFDRMIGLSWRIIPPETEVSQFTNIYKQGQATIPICLTDPYYKIGDFNNFPNIGTPVKREINPYDGDGKNGCTFFSQEIKYCSTNDSSTIPVKVPMKEGLTYENLRGTKINKFVGIREVFALGIPLQNCCGIAKPGRQKLDNTTENTILTVSSIDANITLVKFSEGIHYVTLYPDKANMTSTDDYLPCIQLANNLDYNDKATIGTGVDFTIDSLSLDLLKLFNGGDNISSYTGKATVLPLGKLNGIIINQLWAYLDLDTPCFVVADPLGNAAAIAQGLVVDLVPLVIRDIPRPIAINGELVDQVEIIPDKDPTKLQNLMNTRLEQLLDNMRGRTLSVSLSSLDEKATINLSKKLYSLLTAYTGAVYNHTCPPTDNPKLGTKGPNGGIINTIEYSYTDQGSYLINVTEGPEYFGDFAGIDNGIYYKQTEDISTTGTIVHDLGNHVNYKVQVDGIGVVLCINACAEILTVRDRVSVTIHNNAVES